MSGRRGTAGTAEGMALARHVHDFVWDWVPNQLTPSEHTRKSYRIAMALYVGWLEEAGVGPSELSAADFEAGSIERWLSWLADSRGNSPRTCNVRLAVMRTFCRYVSRHDPTFGHPEGAAASVPARKVSRRKVRGMSVAAVEAIAHVPDQSSRCGRRDLTIIVALYATACRIGELLSMRVSQLRLDDPHPHAIVVGKGAKARVVYLPARAVDHIRAYLEEFHGAGRDPEAYLFYSRNHPAGKAPLSRDAVAKMLRKHASVAHASCADVPTDVTPHRFRHARATHWLEQGMGIEQVSMLLGHAGLQVTMEYLDITVAMESEAIKCLVPSSEPKRWKGSGATLLEYCGLSPE